MLKPAKPLIADLSLEGDEETQEEAEKRQAYLVTAFLFLLSNTVHRIEVLTEALSLGNLSVEGWADEFRREMQSSHAQAWSIGRGMAGDMAPMGRADVETGEAFWSGTQEPFFARFVEELRGDRYDRPGGAMNDAAVVARAKQYAPAIRGAAHVAFRQASAKDVLRWNLGQKDHCQPNPDFPYHCVGLSLEDPKPADEWPTDPGTGDTPCLNHCDCFWTDATGKYTTRGI